MYDVHITLMMMEVIQKRASVSIQFHIRNICFHLRLPDTNITPLLLLPSFPRGHKNPIS